MGLQKKGIIIDSEAFYKFLNKNDEDSKLIYKYILQKKTLLVLYGNDEKSEKELNKNVAMVRQMARLKKRKVAYQVDSREKKQEIDSNNRKVNGNPLRSNDTHIIAIALVEKKARLLFCTEDGDQKLQDDFTDPEIINNPRGKVYKNKTQEHLLR